MGRQTSKYPLIIINPYLFCPIKAYNKILKDKSLINY